MSTRWSLSLFLFSSFFSLAVPWSFVHGQTTLHVDAVNGSPSGTGTLGDPFDSVQAEIDAAVDGDTVLVQPGIYLESIDFGGKAIAVTG